MEGWFTWLPTSKGTMMHHSTPCALRSSPYKTMQWTFCHRITSWGLRTLLVSHPHNCSLVRLVHGIRTPNSKCCCMTYHPSPNGVTEQPPLRHDGRAAGREAPADLSTSLALYQGFQVRTAVYKTPITVCMRTAGWLDQPLHCTARL